MRRSKRSVLLLFLLACAGCGKPSTAQLIDNLKAAETLTRLKAVRTLPERTRDAAIVVPALIEALKDEDADVRRGAALGLGTFGEKAETAVPVLQAAQRDREAEVRKAASVALSYIDPQFPKPSQSRPAPGK
jgi:vesicle coat complex subunit